ncbi:MAG TPA: hypothetical protein VIA06_17480 [Candidatus Dormibacteraeota bacterium]|jgi:hypothetical protein|nr:hypothetical protein [Candidatus Dormibacteraeota bacterium]
MRRWAAIKERFGRIGDISASDVAYLLRIAEGASEVQQLSPKADGWWDAVLDLNRLLDENEEIRQSGPPHGSSPTESAVPRPRSGGPTCAGG